MLQKLHLKFKNCYGIKSLQADFDFSEKRCFAIYAPNGVMKTSFAKTFQDIVADTETVDRVFSNRKTVRNVIDQNGTSIDKDSIFVIEPYNQDYKSDRVSTLLVNKKLKDEYDEIYQEIDEKIELLIKDLKKYSGLKKDIETEISDSIMNDPDALLLALVRVRDEVKQGKTSGLETLLYGKIFNDKVLALVTSSEFREKLSDYLKVYDKLLSASTFFKKGVFHTHNASDISKSLKDNKFFLAEHSLNVNALQGSRRVENDADLEAVINQEKSSIVDNAELVKSFEQIDKQLNANPNLRDFRDYIGQNKFILPELENISRFRQRIWVAYLSRSYETYTALIDTYDKAKDRIEAIVQKAREEFTDWQKVISIFNQRFSVPFIVSVTNQDDVILKDFVPNISFEFRDDETGKPVPIEEGELLSVLSNGEKRALYILNIIFEVEARRSTATETLFIVDDIADSFDYKNKYAIIQYLREILQYEHFYELLLTHNFDFFRTVSSRFSLPRPNRLHASKEKAGISLYTEKYQNNPLTTWKKNLSNAEMLIASIPFVRNLAEFCGYPNEFETLTCLLHIKPDTKKIKVADLEKIIDLILKDHSGFDPAYKDMIVQDLIYRLADNIAKEKDESIELEKKIVISIAIRLRLEELLIKIVNDSQIIDSIQSNQTYALYELCKNNPKFSTEISAICEDVNLMTPENIHLNSFMYEPILDLSSSHLKRLYQGICAL